MTASYRDAITQYVDVAGVNFAYRDVGPKGGTPLVLLHHFTAVIDDWDPALIDALGQHRNVIAFDNRGVGGTGGETPATVEEMARDAASFVQALGHVQVDVLGFSLGGFVAQALALQDPALVRRLILAGTGPAGGTKQSGSKLPELVQEVRRKAAEQNKHVKHFLFFTQTQAGQAAANAFLSRLAARKEDRVKAVSNETMLAHLAAIAAWGKGDEATLAQIEQPTFIANGDDDVMVPTRRSFDLHRLIPNSRLSIYPESGHGAIFQLHELFASQVLDFLE